MKQRNSAALLLVVSLMGWGLVSAQESKPSASLTDAQRALHDARQELTRAQRTQLAAEAKAASARQDVDEAQRALERVRSAQEKANQAQSEAMASSAQAQRKYDAARGVIEQFYLNRQR